MELLQPLFSNLWSVFLIVLFLGGSIFVHELGHFLVARWRGMHVERFSIGFGPKLFSWRGRDGVEYRLSWLPFGGYVLLPQLSDMSGIEGECTTDISKLPPPSYATKLLVLTAGVTCNMILAFLLAGVVWLAGQPTTSSLNTTQIGMVLPMIKPVDGPEVRSPAAEAGIQPGDIVHAVDGKSVDNWLGLMQTLATGSGRAADGRRVAELTIERAGQSLVVVLHPLLSGDEGYRMIGIEPADDMSVEKVTPGSAAAKAGLQPGDRFVAVDDQPLYERALLSEQLQATKGRPVSLKLERGGATLTIALTPQLEAAPDKSAGVYRIGIQYADDNIVIHPSPFKQIADDATMVWRVRSALFSPKSDIGFSKLSGPVGIARGIHSLAQTDFRLVLWFIILVNVNLAILNILPLPVLDGGHILFLTIGKLRGRDLPAKFINATQGVFMVLLFSMLLYVSFFDFRRWARESRDDNPPPAAQEKAPGPAEAGK